MSGCWKSNSRRLETLVIPIVGAVCALFLLATPLHAQLGTPNGGIPGAGGPIFGDPEDGIIFNPDSRISTESGICAVGSTFELAVHAEVTEGVDGFEFEVLWIPEELELLSWREGAAVLAYAEENELPDCDIIVFPLLGIAEVDTEFYEEEFESDVYGTEVLVLEFEVLVDFPGFTFLNLADEWGNFDFMTMEIIPADPIRRGDTNIDGAFSILDALAISEYVFFAGELDCVRAADIDDDGDVDLLDVLDHMTLLFVTPDWESGACDTDLTPDSLTCDDAGCE